MLFSYCIQLCIYFHWCKKDCIYWSFEDEAEPHTLCKDSQIAKRERRGKKGNAGLEKQTVSSVLCVQKVRQSIPTLRLHRFGDCVPAAASSSCAYLTGEEADIALCSCSPAPSRFDKACPRKDSVCHLKQKGETL